MKKIGLTTLVILLLFFKSGAFAKDEKIPNANTQQKILQVLTTELIRLDGEGLASRKGRPFDFITTINQLVAEASNNINANDFYHTFSRFDFTYPNLHARMSLAPDIASQVSFDPNLLPSVWLFVEQNEKGNSKLLVDSIDNKMLKGSIAEGDEVVAINGKAVKDWLDENFLFCKWPLRMQCDLEFELMLHTGILSWKGGPLVYSIKHGDEIIDTQIELRKNQKPSIPKFKRLRCDYNWEKRYPDFKLIYSGRYACVFQNPLKPEIAILRITSFQYNRNSDPEHKIKTMRQEVDGLMPLWQEKSGSWKRLIIDVIDNGGGNEPIPYYQILFTKPFQEQYVRFKKTPEMDNTDLRKTIFWEEKSKELWFQKYKTAGKWGALKIGEFTEPVPMFCVNDDRPCDEGLFTPNTHPFRGEVDIMLNHRCISSCDGFVWAIQRQLGAKLYGFPQAADSAYARLRLDVIEDSIAPDGFRLQVSGQYTDKPQGTLLSQGVAVSLAVSKEGEIFNGNPLPLTKLVLPKFGHTYSKDVLNEVLSQ